MIRPGLALLLVMLAMPAGAEIYKWTDAKGKVHYGDQPPPTTLPKPFDPHVSQAAAARAEEARRGAAEQAVRTKIEQALAREAEAKKQAASEEEARRKADKCQRARGNLEMLQRVDTRMSKLDAQGRPQVLDAAARQAEVERANQAIAENCLN